MEVLRHIFLYLSTRRPQIIGSPGHVRTSFWNSVFPRILSFETKSFFQKSTKKHQISFRGAAPCTPSLQGCAPPPSKVGAKCRAAVVLAHHDRVLSLSWGFKGSKSSHFGSHFLCLYHNCPRRPVKLITCLHTVRFGLLFQSDMLPRQ